MITLTQNDLNFVASRVPRDVRKWMAENNLSIGGGFIREIVAGETPNDIDVFGASHFQLTKSLEQLKVSRESLGQKCRIHKSENADTLFTEGRMPVQCIHRWLYDDHMKVIESFDFTVCAAVFWRDKETTYWQSAIHESFYPDLAAKRLIYTSPLRNEDAGGSLLRVIKFVKRGYNIQTESLGRVVARLVSAVEFDKMQKVMQTGKPDEAHVGKILTSLLREVDPRMVVDGIEPLSDEEQENVR